MGLGGHGRQHADDIGAFVLLEGDGTDVRRIDGVVDDLELGVGIVRSHLRERIDEGEAGHDDRVAAVLGEAAQRLLALRGVGNLEIDIVDAGLLLEFLGAVVGGLVEGFVELAAEIVEQRRLDVVGQRREHHRGCSEKPKNDTFHVIHTLSVILSLRALRRPVTDTRKAPGRAVNPPLAGQSCMGADKIHLEF